MKFFGVLLIILLVAFCGFELYSLFQTIRKKLKQKKEFENSTEQNSQEIERKEYRN